MPASPVFLCLTYLFSIDISRLISCLWSQILCFYITCPIEVRFSHFIFTLLLILRNWKYHIVFYKGCISLHFPPQCTECPVFHTLSPLCKGIFLYYNHYESCEVLAHYGFSLHLPDHLPWHIFQLSVHCMSFLRNAY